MPKQNKVMNYPLVALRGKVIFPDATSSFDVGRLISLTAVSHASEKELDLFVSMQKDAEKEEIEPSDVFSVGTVVKIRQIAKLPSNNLRVTVRGLFRARAEEIYEEDGCLFANVTELPAVHGDPVLEEAYFRIAQDEMREIVANDPRFSKEAAASLDKTGDPDAYVSAALTHLHIKEEIKQTLLETVNVVERLKLFERCLNDELEIARLEKKISATVRRNIDKNQKEYFLPRTAQGDPHGAWRRRRGARHAHRADQKQAHARRGGGEGAQRACPHGQDAPVLARKYGHPQLPRLAHRPAVDGADQGHGGSRRCAEGARRGPLRAGEGKDAHHRVSRRPAAHGQHERAHPLFCRPARRGENVHRQVRRPRAGRKFVRMSLGGVKDEAEIRGHRRTYVGAMPGRIIYAMKQVGSINPVFLLDEIDKVSSDMRGDPASALLEVLDPEQNTTFRDRFLEVPYDLSKVLFITTANTVETIPAPLLDRMELIELNGYTLDEKREIAKRYLVPKRAAANGLQEGFVTLTDEAIAAVIEGYTMEAGVRNLERQIDAVCRKIAVRYAQDKSLGAQVIDEKQVEELLA